MSTFLFLDSRMQYEVLKGGPHNQFVNSGIYYGWLGLFFVLATYYWIVRNLLIKSRKPSLDLAYLPHALFAGFLGCFANSMFHNGGLFVGDHFGWYFFALSYWVIKSRRASIDNAVV